MNIFLGFDTKCLSDDKISTGRVGGTERFFLLLKKFLLSTNNNVTDYDNGELFDVAIYSNATNKLVNAKTQICWCGSLHTNDASDPKYDIVIANSQFMLDSLKLTKPGYVISACFEPEILDYMCDLHVKGKIITTSNPNRHIEVTRHICHILNELNYSYKWIITGGNKLYSDSFPETFSIPVDNHLTYKSVLSRYHMLEELANSHIFCYPNFNDNSETQCVSAIEASALGIPVVLPDRLPFTEVLPDNPYFCNSISDMIKTIIDVLSVSRDHLYTCDISKYTEPVIMSQIYTLLCELI